MNPLRIFLISDHDDRRNALKALLDPATMTLAGESRGGPLAHERVDAASPDAVILTAFDDEVSVMPLAERIYLYRPGCAILLVTDNPSPATLQQAMRAGVRSVLGWPVPETEFRDSVTLSCRQELARLCSGPEVRLNARSRILTVFGTKGGIGKTTVAVNLAVQLARKKFKVALLDLDLQFGDCSVFLDIDARETFAELVQEHRRLDMEILQGYLALHHSGLSLLPAPRSPEFADLIQPDHVSSVISVMKPFFDYIVVDTPPAFNDCTLTALEVSDMILYLAALDISTLCNAKVTMDVLESLQLKDRVRPVINRETESIITLKDAESVMDCAIRSRIPVDWNAATGAINKGIPVVLGAPRSRMSQALVKLADQVAAGKLDAQAQPAETAGSGRADARKPASASTGGSAAPGGAVAAAAGSR